ncbi:MAG: hypothetical protein EXR75_01865 [Myxococcales bacterium]|nr:hypothetical protein [Myxococcales bacterium]
MSLSETVKAPERRTRVVDDCVALVDSEVEKKRGLGGVVIKAGYGAVKGLTPGFVRKVVDGLLDEWVARLEPLWAEALAAGAAPQTRFAAEKGRVADALLSVTDEKAKRADNAIVLGTYKRLRPTAKEHVEAAVPALAALLARHAG